jgi:hypothetical protein
VRKSAQTPARFIFAIFFGCVLISTFPVFAQQTAGSAPTPQQVLDRLGKDDGYALAIHYSGDLHGSLETCG